MIRGYKGEDGHLRAIPEGDADMGKAQWLDLFDPTREEEKTVESWVGVGIPTRADMEEIEVSSRLYHKKQAAFMTAVLPAPGQGGLPPLLMPVTFILAGGRLITLRYHEPVAFRNFPTQAEQKALFSDKAGALLVGLLEAIVDREADVLEQVGHDIETISQSVLQAEEGKGFARSRDFRTPLRDIGRKGDFLGKIQESLVSLQLLLGFLGDYLKENGTEPDVCTHAETLVRDVRSLSEHVGFLSQKIGFLLDATLGMISIEQNVIIKIFSVVAVVLMPPTLIASIFGMNFRYMPELAWPFGYPMALLLMALSAGVSYLYFRRRGWV